MTRVSGFIFAICFAGLSFSGVVAADPPWQRDRDRYDDDYRHDRHEERHKHKHHRKHRYEDRHHDRHREVRYIYVRERHVPPPWAPAHGHRHHDHAAPTTVVIDVPVREERVYREGYRDDYRDAEPEMSFEATSEKIGITQSTCNREAVGTVVGGILGAVIGNKTASRKNKTISTLVGTVFGAALGKQIGRNMDDTDAHCSNQVLERASDGQSVKWDNPETNSSYAMKPVKSYQQNDGRYCRQYQTTVYDNRGENRYDQTACRNDQGVWETLN